MRLINPLRRLFKDSAAASSPRNDEHAPEPGPSNTPEHAPRNTPTRRAKKLKSSRKKTCWVHVDNAGTVVGFHVDGQKRPDVPLPARDQAALLMCWAGRQDAFAGHWVLVRVLKDAYRTACRDGQICRTAIDPLPWRAIAIELALHGIQTSYRWVRCDGRRRKLKAFRVPDLRRELASGALAKVVAVYQRSPDQDGSDREYRVSVW